MTSNVNLDCKIVGLGAWGPGFQSWPELKHLLRNGNDNSTELHTVNPQATIIPANERRRAPLPVKAAVEVSWQAVTHAEIPATQTQCVFGSGLGDTEITDYMCQVLTSDAKQLSPTKFHNSVHNAAAGYWTISTGCMKAANSVAAYFATAAVTLLEGVAQCLSQNEPVLVTLFDTAAHNHYHQIYPCRQHFAAALLLAPSAMPTPLTLAHLTVSVQHEQRSDANLQLTETFSHLYQYNPAAKILPLLTALAKLGQADGTCVTYLPITANSLLRVQLQP